MGEAEIRILLTEDDPLDAKAIIRELSKWRNTRPVSVEHVDRLALALEKLQKNKYDIIITDLHLPDSQGVETVKRLVEQAPEIPVVVMTGTYLEEEPALEAIRNGAQDYLLKNQLDGEHLMRVIRYAILRQQTEKMQEVVKLKSEFIATVSHELRTPLTVIQQGVGIVQDGTLGPISAEQAQFLEVALQNIDRLARLINNVLDFQKSESSQLKPLEIQGAENDMNQLVEEVRKNFALIAKNTGLEIRAELEAQLPLLPFDRDRIVQVLDNLVNNAVQSMKTGTITLRTRRHDNTVRVSVEDQGCGIKQEDFPKLFVAFSQLSKGNERRTNATGLGLAISKQIIEAHKGKIGLESVYGKGSTFYFLLPIKERRRH